MTAEDAKRAVATAGTIDDAAKMLGKFRSEFRRFCQENSITVRAARAAREDLLVEISAAELDELDAWTS